jgi:hypothetical protein
LIPRFTGQWILSPAACRLRGCSRLRTSSEDGLEVAGLSPYATNS